MEIHGRQRGTRRVTLEVWGRVYVVVVVEGDEILSHEEYPDLKAALEAYRWTK